MTKPDKLLIYDEHCPMCRWYTGLFVRNGILQATELINFEQLESREEINLLQFPKAAQEIPLIDMKSGKTLYGVDSIVHLLNQKMPGLKTLHSFWPFKKLAQLAYLFVSYNRRVIIPAKCTDTCGNPGTNWTFRIALILLAGIISMGISLRFGEAVDELMLTLGWNTFGSTILLLVGSGWIIQSIFAFKLPSQLRAIYWGHLAVIMTLGVFVLLPFVLLSSFSFWFIGIGVLCSSVLMLWQHTIRIRTMELPQLWTWSWFINLQVTAIIVFIINQTDRL